MLMITLYAKQKKRYMYRTDFWTLWEKARVGWSERTALKHVYYLGWKRSPAQVGFMRQVLGPGALGRPRGIGWRGRREGRSGWGTHVNPWLIHINVWQNPLQYCKVISLQLIEKKKKKRAAKLLIFYEMHIKVLTLFLFKMEITLHHSCWLQFSNINNIIFVYFPLGAGGCCLI